MDRTYFEIAGVVSFVMNLLIMVELIARAVDTSSIKLLFGSLVAFLFFAFLAIYLYKATEKDIKKLKERSFDMSNSQASTGVNPNSPATLRARIDELYRIVNGETDLKFATEDMVNRMFEYINKNFLRQDDAKRIYKEKNNIGKIIGNGEENHESN